MHNLTTQAADLTAEIGESEPASEIIVRAVASVTNTGILDLEPLYDVIDPEYLDGLFERSAIAVDSTLTFTYAGCTVTVTREAVHVSED